MHSKIAAALLDAVTTAVLDAARWQGGRKRALLSTVDGLEVDTKIANALLGLATEAFVAAQLASRDASISALQGAKADTSLLASYATNAALSASKTTLQSALDAILAELAALQLSGSGGVVNAPAWAGFTTWELVRGSSVVRNLHLERAPLSAALANGDDTLSITADCYSIAAADAALAAALLAYYTLHRGASGRAVGRLPNSAISAALLAPWRKWTPCWPTTGKRAGHTDAGSHHGRAAGLPDGPGPGRLHDQPDHLGAGGVSLGCRPGHGNGIEHRSRTAQLLHHHAGGRPPSRQARSHGGSLGLRTTEGPTRWWQILPHGRLPGKRRFVPAAAAAWSWPPTPWARPRAPLCLPVPARHSLQLRGAHVRGRQRLRPPVRQLRG